ncbi:hypothetical protein LJR220_004885 [Bradyrhizobium sp. LjRoot220]|uniref:hypothetical protein n=1 Tax=Bradyrhizobium sp. LjRoot220 TaxID=3342284 RepID=UPI003ED16142
MPLHRDIHWIGRQWAVTGRGLQLIDQKQKGAFDIDVAQLWDQALIETVRGKEWLNVVDFDKGLSVARTRFPPGSVTRPPEATSAPAMPFVPTAVPAAPPIAPVAPPVVAPPIAPIEPPPTPAALQAPAIAKPDPEPPTAPAKFHMLFSGCAKFIRPWRVRMRK